MAGQARHDRLLDIHISPFRGRGVDCFVANAPRNDDASKKSKKGFKRLGCTLHLILLKIFIKISIKEKLFLILHNFFTNPRGGDKEIRIMD